jgi:hypothetical protein
MCTDGYPRPRSSLFYPECLWEEYGLVGECDGAVKYVDAFAYELEKEREQILRDLNYGVVRWLAKEATTSAGDP